MSKKFDRVLSNEDLLDVYRSLDNPKHDRDSVIEAMGAAVDAAMAKLAEQVPVAWINAKKLETMHKDKRFNRVLWQTVLRVDKVEDNEIPLYAHPMPCVSNTSYKTACVSENGESEDQDIELLKQALESMIGAAHPAHVTDDFLRNKLIKARDVAFKALENHRLNAKERHITTKNHIADASKTVGSDHIPDIGQMIPEGYALVPVEITAEMLRDAHIRSELGAYAVSNLSEGYSLIRNLYDVLVASVPKYTGDK